MEMGVAPAICCAEMTEHVAFFLALAAVRRALGFASSSSPLVVDSAFCNLCLPRYLRIALDFQIWALVPCGMLGTRIHSQQ